MLALAGQDRFRILLFKGHSFLPDGGARLILKKFQVNALIYLTVLEEFITQYLPNFLPFQWINLSLLFRGQLRQGGEQSCGRSFFGRTAAQRIGENL